MELFLGTQALRENFLDAESMLEKELLTLWPTICFAGRYGFISALSQSPKNHQEHSPRIELEVSPKHCYV